MNNKELIERIKNKKASIGIIGMGYVGIPLGIEFAKNGFKVIGFDTDTGKVKDINSGKQIMKHISQELMKEFIANGSKASYNFEELKDVECILMCVPTPLDVYEQPDMSYVKKATETISKNLNKGKLIILESTTYPGTTKEIIKPILEESGLSAGKDFFLAYSPEREDPGNKDFSVSRIPKVIGGLTPKCLEVANTLYSEIIEETVKVSSPETAEATKLMENIFRAVNIAMINELKLIFERMDINVWEVIEAANSKPFGFMPFYPGPGMGGHCIPIDPFYLSWKAKEYNTEAKFIELAGEINRKMTENVAHRIGKGLNDHSKSIRKSEILVLGLAYKKDIDDMRESPALKIIELLKFKGANVSYHDPYIKHATEIKYVELNEKNLSKADAVVITTDHSNVNYEDVGKYASLVIDTRNVMANVKNPKAHILRA
ncbi:MAG: UDP-N-acetyl-D-glucosamine dehydrogenase [Marine Group III euryarchaeote CG-Epi3]|uniref:UDP-N-acetyl-D-mannosamine dehydrogenase n=1 Tax=Marine Group III euryarchaeote CG-Epi3 TaxID=1888997 RepID=A0A1J5UHB7_9ARCH|nr:MAG: UDP-N-acetyl-D-glucosamine dehydrogenase [Marine Group III euryarchaeote CG-Epi3]